MLAGQKNLSLTFLESTEFYDLIIACLITGGNMLDRDKHTKSLKQQAEEFFPIKDRFYWMDWILRIFRYIAEHAWESAICHRKPQFFGD